MSDSSAAAAQQDQGARKLFQEGREAEQNRDRWTAIDRYEQAFEQSTDDPEVCFRLAYHLDLVGEESQARDLYEQACAGQSPPLNALLNLAILYEDQGEYAKAERCLKLVVETDPNHEVGRLYLKDVQASRDMVPDQQTSSISGIGGGLLETPVTDFALSSRARNCLKQMEVRTLGDLLRISEADLMAYKNFGESTLQEIRDMLSSRGLQIGQALQQRQEQARQEVYEQLKDTASEEAINIFNKPVEDLDLSVRARKALELLNIQTIGDLISRTEDELLGIKNFGSTSLEEIKQKLAAHGLSLRVLDDNQ